MKSVPGDFYMHRITLLERREKTMINWDNAPSRPTRNKNKIRPKFATVDRICIDAFVVLDGNIAASKPGILIYAKSALPSIVSL